MANRSGEQTKSARATGARGSLDPRTLTERALQIADAEGLDAVTIRRMAAEHGVTAMAIYWHFRDKDELFGAIADLVFAEVVAPEPAADDVTWEKQLKAELDAFLQVMRNHPNLTDIVLGRILENEPGLAMANRILGLLVARGFSIEEAAEVGTYLLCAVITLVVAEPGPPDTLAPDEHEAEVRNRRAKLLALPPEKFPHVVAAASALADCRSQGRYFDQGLDILVGGTFALRG